MKIIHDTLLNNFNFWGEAADRAKALSHDEICRVESILEQEYPDGIDATLLNDMFWFDMDMIAGWLGYERGDDIINKDDPKYIFERAFEFIRQAALDSVQDLAFDFNDAAVWMAEHNITKEEFLAKEWRDYVQDIMFPDTKLEKSDYEEFEDTIWCLNKFLLCDDIDKAVLNEEFTEDMREAITYALDDLRDWNNLNVEQENFIDNYLMDALAGLDIEEEYER